MEKVESGAHVALLDAEGGAGILVRASLDDDLRVAQGASLHAADWDSLVSQLVKGGCAFVADEWDLPMVLATTTDGETVHGLYPELVDARDEPPTDEEDRTYLATCLGLLTSYADAD